MISVLILCRNEQHDLPDCLASVAFSDDVHVLDSGSTDATTDIAASLGAHVSLRSYPDGAPAFGGDESAHRNWALRHLPFRHPWVLVVDADERVTPELAAAVLAAAADPGPCVAYRVRRRDHFLGTWLAHVQTSALYMRFVRPDAVRYERLVNPVLVPDGAVGDLDGHLDHYPFSKGMTHWLARHNGYSSLEAAQIVANRRTGASFSLRKAFVCRDFNERRFHQKELFYRLPLRPLVKFLLLYVGKRGFLDGRAGLTYAVLQAVYEYFIVIKTRELEVAPGAARPHAVIAASAERGD